MSIASRDVALAAGQTATLDIDIATGELTLRVEVLGEHDAHIDAAQVFLLDAGPRPTNAKQLLEEFARSRSTGARSAFAFPPKPAEFAQLTSGAYAVCVLPINGDLDDPNFGQRLERHVDTVAVYCQDTQVQAGPREQRYTAVVPPMNPLPE